MDGFGFDASLKRREAEQARRREVLLKQMNERTSQAAVAEQRTSEILAAAQARKREDELKAEFERALDEGAPDNGVKVEAHLTAVIQPTLRPDSDRVCLPADLLTDLTGHPDVAFPLLFELYNPVNRKRTHCGVLEFSAETGTIQIPAKVAHCLEFTASSATLEVRMRYKVLPRCTSVSIKVPVSMYGLFPDFRSFLESCLRTQYATLTSGDQLIVGGSVPLLVDQTEPESAVCIIDADVELDLSVVGEEAGDKWLVGSEASFDGQKRLWLRPLRDNEVIQISRADPGDVLVSFPPSTEASLQSFDLIADSELQLTKDDLLVHQSPDFITIGVGQAGPASAVKAEIVQKSPQQAATSSNSVECNNCLRHIPSGALDLHLVRCKSLFRLCGECQKPVPLKEPHFHCSECGHSFSDPKKHQELWHSQITCLCGASVTRATVQAHRQEICPQRLLQCRFCQLWVPRGSVDTMDARDRLMGFQSEHEAACGNRTEPCSICHRRERLKDMAFHHQAFHSGA